MVNILLVEDHKLVRDGIKMLLESENSLKVVDEVDSGEGALAKLKEGLEIDLVITDINVNGMDGLALTQQIKETYPQVKVIILSMLSDAKTVAQSFDNGAHAYIIKTSDYNELLFAIPYVIQGGKFVCESIMLDMMKQITEVNEVSEQHQHSMLQLDISEREMEILQLIAEGFTNNDIANKLFLSKRTVEGHRQNLIDKVHVKNSAQLVKYAVKNGLI